MKFYWEKKNKNKYFVVATKVAHFSDKCSAGKKITAKVSEFSYPVLNTVK